MPKQARVERSPPATERFDEPHRGDESLSGDLGALAFDLQSGAFGVEQVSEATGPRSKRLRMKPVAFAEESSASLCSVPCSRQSVEHMRGERYVANLNSGHNLGVFVVAPSGGVCSINIDDDARVEPILALNPQLQNHAVHARKTRRKCTKHPHAPRRIPPLACWLTGPRFPHRQSFGETAAPRPSTQR